MQERAAIVIADRSAWVGYFHRRSGRPCLAEQHEFTHDTPLLPRRAAEVESLCDQLRAHLEGRKTRAIGARVAIPAGWCLIQDVDVARSRRREETARLAFEPQSPVSLEALVCAIQDLGQDRARVVAAYGEVVAAVVQELEDAGMEIEVLTVDALLAFPRGATDQPRFDGQMLWDGHRMSIVAFGSGSDSPVSIRTVALSPQSTTDYAAHHLAGTLMGLSVTPRRWCVCPLSRRPDVITVETALGSHGLEVHTRSVDESGRCLLEALAEGGQPLNLCGGDLGQAGLWRPLRRAMTRAAAAATALLVVMGVGFAIQGRELRRAMSDLTQMQAGLHARVFPEAAVPAFAALRLRSERVKLEALTEGKGGAEPLHAGVALESLQLLHDVTAQIPGDVKLNIQEINLEERGMQVVGRTTSHSAAGDWVQAINRSAVAEAEPPRTKLRKDGIVEFRIQARRVTPDGSH